MKTDPLADAKLKIERANTNILDVQAQITDFFSTMPPHYEVFRQLKEDGSTEFLKIRIIREPPGSIAAAIGDVVTNLRSALDFLTCELAIKNGRNDLSGVEFPFAESHEKLKLPRTQKKIEKLSPDAIDLINSQRPYKRGNDLLWALNAVRRPNIHRHLIVAAVSVGFAHGSVKLIPATAGLHSLGGAVPWHPSDREITVLDFPPHSQLEGNLQVGMDIVIRDVEPIEGQPVIAVLQQFSGLTSRIISTFENRFF